MDAGVEVGPHQDCHVDQLLTSELCRFQGPSKCQLLWCDVDPLLTARELAPSRDGQVAQQPRRPEKQCVEVLRNGRVNHPRFQHRCRLRFTLRRRSDPWQSERVEQHLCFGDHFWC